MKRSHPNDRIMYTPIGPIRLPHETCGFGDGCFLDLFLVPSVLNNQHL